MTIAPDSKLARAFRIVRREAGRPPFRAQGYTAPLHRGESYAHAADGMGHAAHALSIARSMEAAPAPIYGGGPGLPYAEPADAFRYVGRVVPDEGGRFSPWDTRGDCGWTTDPYGDVFRDGTGLCYGVVYQLPARKGESRFVAGYEFGGMDGGPDLDLSTVYAIRDEETAEDGAYHSGATAAADSMAKAAAEEEREYQTAWRAGSDWAIHAEEVAEARQAALALLAERRQAKARAGDNLPAICSAIRDSVAGHVQTIREARERMAELAEGDAEGLIFWPGEERLKGAFCEGAGLDDMPEARA